MEPEKTRVEKTKKKRELKPMWWITVWAGVLFLCILGVFSSRYELLFMALFVLGIGLFRSQMKKRAAEKENPERDADA